MSLICIAVDAMGGDYGVEVTLPAVCQFLQNSQNSDCCISLIGQQAAIDAGIEAHAEANALVAAGRLKLVHATQVVEMSESPHLLLNARKIHPCAWRLTRLRRGRPVLQ